MHLCDQTREEAIRRHGIIYLIDHVLTPAQKKRLLRANANGIIDYKGPNGRGRSAWNRCMLELVRHGCCDATAHSDYRVTAYGKLVIEWLRGTP